MRFETPQPCSGPIVSAFNMRRSRLPWRRSAVGFVIESLQEVLLSEDNALSFDNNILSHVMEVNTPSHLPQRLNRVDPQSAADRSIQRNRRDKKDERLSGRENPGQGPSTRSG